MEHETKKKSELQVNLLDHDVRNVFNNISSSIELCKIFLKDSHEMDKVSEQFNIINGQIARGITLMSNVRKLYLFNETSVTTNPTDFYSILKKAIDFIQRNFQDRENKINIEYLDENGYVNADELILDIFENILINSILHNFNSVIRILIKITETQKSNKNFIKFEFIDNGIGISDARKRKMFGKGHNKDKNIKGLGFGLSLVKKIVESYQGEIWIEDRIKGDYTKGTNFIILIPKAVET